MGRVVGMPVLYQRKEMLHALEQSESSVVLGGYAGFGKIRNTRKCVLVVEHSRIILRKQLQLFQVQATKPDTKMAETTENQ